MVAEDFYLWKRRGQDTPGKGLEDIIDTIGLKCFYGILIICRAKDYRCMHCCLPENIKAKAVSQLNIHENKVGGRWQGRSRRPPRNPRGLARKPIHRLTYALPRGHNLRPGLH